MSVNSFQTLDSFSLNGKEYNFYNLSLLEDEFPKLKTLPKSKKYLLKIY